MNISFIIVNYRSREYLEKCVSSVLAMVKDVEFEIVVVNNDEEKISSQLFCENGFSKNVLFSRLSHSADSSKKKQFFEKHSDNGIDNSIIDKFKNKLKIIEVNENIGFGRACNLGAKKVEGEILCFLNPDTEIISENINDILKELKNNKEIGVIGPKITEKNGKVQKWITGKELNLWRILKNNFGIIDDEKIWLSKEKRETAWVTGAVLFIKKNLFEKIDGFDERFFMYFEDVDLCKQVRMKKYKILFFPKFTVRHLGGGSAKNRQIQKKEYYKSQDYYFQKWFGVGKTIILQFLRRFHKKY